MPDPISWEFSGPYFAAALLGGYLLGSIPFGLILTRLFGLGDIRTIGSGNIGTTNVLRTGRKDVAALTLLLDAGKGAAAVLIAGRWGPDMAIMAGYGAFLGHLFPLWLKFKGGKGVATAAGLLLGMAWPVGLAALGTWIAVVAATRLSSLAALVTAALAPLFAWLFLKDLQMVEFCALLAVLVWLRHAKNIGRLLKGQEPKIGKG